mgnify:CR=1 FL=1
MSNNIDKLGASTMISLKHLQHLHPNPVKLIVPHAMGKTVWQPPSAAELNLNHPKTEEDRTVMSILKGRGYVTLPRHHVNAVSLTWDPSVGRYMWSDEIVTPITRFIGRSSLWESMFGVPAGFVTDRFTRPFQYRLISFTSNFIRRHGVRPYLDMDWLTNVVVPRINQYDPVDYVKYCEEHLQYSPTPVPAWKSKTANRWGSDALIFGMPEIFWTPPLRIEDTKYAIDDTCKWILAQMFPVKSTMKKRII